MNGALAADQHADHRPGDISSCRLGPVDGATPLDARAPSNCRSTIALAPPRTLVLVVVVHRRRPCGVRPPGLPRRDALRCGAIGPTDARRRCRLLFSCSLPASRRPAAALPSGDHGYSNVDVTRPIRTILSRPACSSPPTNQCWERPAEWRQPRWPSTSLETPPIPRTCRVRIRSSLAPPDRATLPG